jgi:hypothetical protein
MELSKAAEGSRSPGRSKPLRLALVRVRVRVRVRVSPGRSKPLRLAPSSPPSRGGVCSPVEPAWVELESGPGLGLGLGLGLGARG